MGLCKKCLLEEMGEAYGKTIDAYIDSLPSESRTQKKEQERRVALCLSCDKQWNGMCRLCGCFVEIRAAKRRMRCPHTPPRW